VTVCPCCGFKFAGDLSKGCEACGARSVGEALPRPEYELPSYARSLLLSAVGTLMVLVFVAETIVAWAQRVPLSVGFGAWTAAAETAAWRLKWVAIPATLIVLWGTRKIYGSILRTPARFCGLRYARRGFMASALVLLLIATLIGITVPQRLRQRQWAIEAAFYAQAYTIDRALLEYRSRFGTLPSDINNLSRDLPDPDGSIAAALATLDATGYETRADLAALPKQKPRTLRGAVIRNASMNSATDDTAPGGLSFTNYVLRLRGADKLMGTEDDLILSDGVITRATETSARVVTKTASTISVKP